MSTDAEQRKLAAIMFTDMVGYSALSQRDEKLAQELLQEHRQLLREIFPRFHGTEIKTIGDAFLVEFNSALEAAQCAIEIQRSLAKRDADAPADRQIQIRIGIHIGDVVHRDGDVYGDGVNIASRIEPLANPGGICLSMDVERQIRSAVETRVEKLAPRELKNISVSMDLFRIVLPWEHTPEDKGQPVRRSLGEGGKSEIGKSRVTSARFPWHEIVIGILLVAALIGGAMLWFNRAAPATKTAAENPAAATRAISEKSIAVLPFVNMSEDKENEYFSDGISEELLNLLAKIPQLQVTARTSSFSFKGKDVAIPEIARTLHVAHVLEGSVRKAGDQVRITAQLIKAATGTHLWSQTYDRKLDDIFAIQDEIAADVVKQLKVTLLGAAPKARTTDPEAYALYLQAVQLGRQSTAEAFQQSDALLQQGAGDRSALRPGVGRAGPQLHQQGEPWPAAQQGGVRPSPRGGHEGARDRSGLRASPCRARLRRDVRRQRPRRRGAAPQARAGARSGATWTCCATAPRCSGISAAWTRRWRSVEAVIRRDPVNVAALYNLGLHQRMAGRLDAAIASFRTVLSLAPGRGGAHAELGTALLLKGDAQGALAEIEQETSEVWRMIGLPMAYHALGRKAESDAALAALIAKHEKDARLQHRLRLRLPRRGRQGLRVARQGGRVRRRRPRARSWRKTCSRTSAKTRAGCRSCARSAKRPSNWRRSSSR